MLRRYTEPDPTKALFREDIKFPFAMTSSGDLATVTGVPNLEQAIVERACTRRGEIEHREGYGIDTEEEQGGPNTALSHASLQARLLEQYQRETRLKDVKVTIESTEDDVVAFIDGQAKNGQGATANVSLSQ